MFNIFILFYVLNKLNSLFRCLFKLMLNTDLTRYICYTFYIFSNDTLRSIKVIIT